MPPSGLEDSLGRLIDGNHDGKPRGNAVALLTRGGATIGAVVYRGIGPIPSFEPSAVDVLLELEDLRLGKPFARTARSRP